MCTQRYTLSSVELTFCLQAKRLSDGEMFAVRVREKPGDEEETLTMRRDYEFSLQFQDASNVARVEAWLLDNVILREHLLPLPGQMSLPEFLKMAVQITDALAYIHDCNVLHNNINPTYVVWVAGDNSCRAILYSPEDQGYKLTELGWATSCPSDKSFRSNIRKGKHHYQSLFLLGYHVATHFIFANWVEEYLVYISPEQTGRLNRNIDFRSDLYSLVGVPR